MQTAEPRQLNSLEVIYAAFSADDRPVRADEVRRLLLSMDRGDFRKFAQECADALGVELLNES